MSTAVLKPPFQARVFFLVIIIAAAAVFVSGCGLEFPVMAQSGDPTPEPVVTRDPQVIAEGQVVPSKFSWLNFATSGKVSQILVEEGEMVEKGTVLARLGNREQAEAALAGAELEQLDAEQSLNKLHQKAALAASQIHLKLLAAEIDLLEARELLEELDTQDYQDEIDQARQDVIDARDELDEAQDEMDKYADFSEDNPARINAEAALEEAEDLHRQQMRVYERLVNRLEQARANLALAEEALEDAREDYEARQSGPDRDELALAESRLRNTQAQVAAARAAIDHLDLIAPFNGVIVEIDVSEDEWASPQQPAFLLADFSAWYVETNDLTEMDIVKIDPTKSVRVVPDALPDVNLAGEIEKISDSFLQLRGDVVYTVRILLDESHPQLRWGMTVQVTFQR